MAKSVPILQSTDFMLRMDDKDMVYLTEITQRKKCNYPQAVLACFHNGLVLAAKQCSRCQNKD